MTNDYTPLTVSEISKAIALIKPHQEQVVKGEWLLRVLRQLQDTMAEVEQLQKNNDFHIEACAAHQNYIDELKAELAQERARKDEFIRAVTNVFCDAEFDLTSPELHIEIMRLTMNGGIPIENLDAAVDAAIKENG